MLSLSKGLFIFLGLFCLGANALSPDASETHIKIAPYNDDQNIDTVIYIGPDIPKTVPPTGPNAYPQLYDDLKKFKAVSRL